MPYKYEPNIKVQTTVRPPKMFAVVMHNDDYTSMDFVVDILQKIFQKNETDANRIMLEIHNAGKAVAGVYTYDIAVTKKTQADQLADEKGFPLKLTIAEA